MTIAGVVNTDLNRKWLAQLEICYIQKGSLDDINAELGDYSYYKMKIDYVEVPIVFIYTYKKIIRIEAGQAIGYLVNNVESNENGTLRNQTDFKKLDFSSIIGLNYLFENKINFSLRYMHSNLPIRGNLSDGTYYRKGGQYNKLLSFTIGYYFLRKTI